MTPLLLTDADVFAGTERHIHALAVAMRRQGADACVGVPTPSPLAQRCEADGVPVICIPKTGSIDRPAIAALASLLLERRIDFIHTHNGRTTLNAALAIRKAGRGRLVATQHFIEPTRATRRGPKRWLSSLVHRWLSPRIDAHLAISRAVRDAMLSRGDAPADRIHLVHNGLDDLDASTFTSTRTALRASLGCGDEHVLVACASRLEREKNLALLLDAIARLTSTHPLLRCVIAGTGQLRDELQSRLASMPHPDRTRLLGFRDDVLALFHAADIVVLPASAEPFGLVLIEAMSLARPLIATASGGPLDVVEPEQTGLLVPPNDPAALAAAIARLAGDPALRDRFGRAGRERFLAHFTADRMARDTLAAYASLPAT
jgi:glycosyltransferase involved in cell wall biosynthesis